MTWVKMNGYSLYLCYTALTEASVQENVCQHVQRGYRHSHKCQLGFMQLPRGGDPVLSAQARRYGAITISRI